MRPASHEARLHSGTQGLTPSEAWPRALSAPRTTGDRQEARRHASVLVLKELAVNAPTLFYSYVQQFFDSIWGALRDPKVGWPTCPYAGVNPSDMVGPG